MKKFSLLRNLIFRFRYLFQGVPVLLGNEKFRLDESLRRWDLEGESELRKALSELIQDGNTVIDIGANFGFHSLYAARKVGVNGFVHSFEPIPGNIQLLKKNIKLNSLCNKIFVIPAAVSNSLEPYIKMSVPSEDVGVSAAIINVDQIDGKEIKVRNFTLDTYINQSNVVPNIIKIDVEGAEHEVLKGAAGVLAKHKPILIIEIHSFALPSFGSSSQGVIEYVKSFGYSEKRIEEIQGNAGHYFHSVFLPHENAK